MLYGSVGEVGVPIRFPGDFKRLISNQCMLFELQCNWKLPSQMVWKVNSKDTLSQLPSKRSKDAKLKSQY